ncbi:competence type IV pilus ATPase ComGA [Salimicrobium halophilum]|uniref:Competence-related pilin export protein ComGA n=1 Tax=Salimicrobium halophilum TaxID=86666 RepID=A0A1G8PU33_9BACI|nr:competence type IV pilus ATPase ComGA [Salimicrobium halophilum]SDI95735.1 competence-related pilin export protein ComGA [Salimicrobium halophilum]
MNVKTLSEEILRDAIEKEASDIHFIPHSSATHIFMRVAGIRTFYRSITPFVYQKLLAYFKFSSEMDIGEMKFPQNGRISHRFHDDQVDLRLSTLPLSESESLAIRLLSSHRKLPIHRLFLFRDQLNKVLQWCDYSSGLVLFTGPTGCGKSTTLYAIMDTILEQRGLQAITLEDPVEKYVPGIIQVQINEKNGFTYDEGLKAALRHDPDIIMVGELRDEKTAQFAVRAALSGHLVFSTLHAKDAQGTIRRLLEMNIPESDLQQTLRAIASQRLINSPLIKRRAAIMEILEEDSLASTFDGHLFSSTQTFPHIKKKAIAYGYLQP